MNERHLPDLVELDALADQLIADLPQHPSGRTARTVLAGDHLRAVVIALRDGVEMSEHDAPAAATLHCLRGAVTLRSADREQPVGPGQLVPIPSERHAVQAHADSAFLLTVALAR